MARRIVYVATHRRTRVLSISIDTLSGAIGLTNLCPVFEL